MNVKTVATAVLMNHLLVRLVHWDVDESKETQQNGKEIKPSSFAIKERHTQTARAVKSLGEHRKKQLANASTNVKTKSVTPRGRIYFKVTGIYHTIVKDIS